MHTSTFEYLKPTDNQIETMANIRAGFKSFTEALVQHLPEGPDKTYVIRHIREAAMWANISITRLPDGTPRP